MKSILVKDFNLNNTLECGQFFRYHEVNGYYYISHRDYLFKLRQQKGRLFYQGITDKFLTYFLRLDDDYITIIKKISKDKHIKKAIKSLHGLRLIRQDPWECLISYICSSNSNIPKIKMNLNCIAESFGKPQTLDNFKSYTFPNPGELSNSKKLWDCKVGYRAEYIKKVNKDITNSYLMQLKKASYHTARERLIKLSGVGDKIADCVLMFSLNKLNAFPVDVWVKRIMQELYFENKNVSNNKIREFGQEYFSRYASYANQFLFYYRRIQK